MDLCYNIFCGSIPQHKKKNREDHMKQLNRIKAMMLSSIMTFSVICTIPPVQTSAANLLSADFETTNDSFSGRGAASAAWTSDAAYVGNCSLFVSGRTASWNGAIRDANSLLRSGQTYEISAAVLPVATEQVEMKLSLQYTDSSGTVQYDAIVLETVSGGQWSILENTAYTVPEGAKELSIYMETTESLTDFYLDMVSIQGAPAVIKTGDANGDLAVNMADAVQLAKYLCLSAESVEMGADMNNDGVISSVDLSLLKMRLLNPPSSPSVNGDWDNYQETASSAMLQVYRDGLYRVGNTYRIREKIAAAQQGEEITIAYLGGSITAGGSSTSHAKCFASLSHSYFAETFGNGSNVKYVNAGLAGTSSVVGNLRVDREVFAYNADIIFIEFAVNDQGGDRFRKSYEALIKKCLSQPNSPAVIPVTLCTQSGGSCQDWMAQIAEHYDLPVISGKDAIQNAISAGTMTWNDYGSGDTTHPGDGGHQMIADCIGYYYRQALRSENNSDGYEIPETSVFGAEYATARLYTAAELQNLNTGSFTQGTNQSAYADGFTFSKNGNAPLTFTVQGKGILLLFQSNSNDAMGTAVVNVNGTSREVSSNLQWTWGGLDGDLGYYQPQSGELSVSISMKDPSKTFVLYGIAVIE